MMDHRENTQKVLDILDKYNAKATFFVTGTNEEYYHLIKKLMMLDIQLVYIRLFMSMIKYIIHHRHILMI